MSAAISTDLALGNAYQSLHTIIHGHNNVYNLSTEATLDLAPTS